MELSWISLLLILALAAMPVEAVDCPSYQHKRSDRVPIVKDMVNPTPLADDFELPMPCGAKLIFRLVCVPAQYLFDDLQLEIGCTDCGRSGQSFMDSKHLTALAGAFRLEDLPAVWRDQVAGIAGSGDYRCLLPGDGTTGSLYYFIGKYEVSNYQWQVVMNQDCPGWDATYTSEDPRPKTNVSWFEAVDFTRRYTEWLLKNDPRTLPELAAGRRAFIRLPTEAEWEYAARGGQRVTPSQISTEAFFPLQDRPLADYAFYTETGAAKSPEKLAWIGTRCANPLGLFDTAGNAAEMMLDPFRFSLDSRLHGAAGGFVIKGGSYLKHRFEIMPGRREEMPFFLDQGSFRSADLGFRVLLSAIITPASRSQLLKGQWTAIHPQSRTVSTDADSAASPESLVADLERLANGSADGTGKEKFDQIRDYIHKTTALRAEKEVEVAKALIWKALFAAESIVTTATRCKQFQNELEMLGGIEKEKLPESEFESLKSNIEDLDRQLDTCDASLDQLAASYLLSLENSRKYPASLLQRQLKLMSEALGADAAVSVNLTRRLAIFRNHLLLLSSPTQPLSSEKIFADLLPIDEQ